MSIAKSHSSLGAVRLFEKMRQGASLFRWYLRRGDEFAEIFDNIDFLRTAYERYAGKSFQNARIFEIGYGARPIRLISMIGMGLDARGIDMDVPMLRVSLRDLRLIFVKNGLERMLKTAVRALLFDPRERLGLRRALAQRGYRYRLDASRFLVGDAADFEYGSVPIDFIFSHCVFEHIPPADLESLVSRLAAVLAPDGVAVIVVDVYTSIVGGHLLEWYPHVMNDPRPKRSEPWEHLRKKRFSANTYLNCLPRKSYRELFSSYFEIVEETVSMPDLGRRFLTPEIRQELAEWDEEDLFSAFVQFVLRPKVSGRRVPERAAHP